MDPAGILWAGFLFDRAPLSAFTGLIPSGNSIDGYLTLFLPEKIHPHTLEYLTNSRPIFKYFTAQKHFKNAKGGELAQVITFWRSLPLQQNALGVRFGFSWLCIPIFCICFYFSNRL